jgi:hypothetical protein
MSIIPGGRDLEDLSSRSVWTNSKTPSQPIKKIRKKEKAGFVDAPLSSQLHGKYKQEDGGPG